LIHCQYLKTPAKVGTITSMSSGLFPAPMVGTRY